MVVKDTEVKPIGDTFWYITKDGVAWKNMPSQGGWTVMPRLNTGYYRIKGALYNPQTAIWKAWRGPVEKGYRISLKNPEAGLHLDNLEKVRITSAKPVGVKARQQREALVRSNLRRLCEVENLLLSTFARHYETRHKGTYQGSLLLQQEYNEIVQELKELGVDYIRERERREPLYIP